MVHCYRCHAQLQKGEGKISWFTGDTICDECSRMEKGAPNFRQAHLSGLDSYAAGGTIDGIGLTEDDMQYIRYTRKPKHARQK